MQPPVYVLLRDAIVLADCSRPEDHLVHGVLEVNYCHVRLLPDVITQQVLTCADGNRLNDLHRCLADAASRGQHADIVADVVVTVDPLAPRQVFSCW